MKQNYINATMVSYLYRFKPKKGLFSKAEWKQHFFVLSSVGILQFDSFDDKRPSALISVMDT